MLIRKAVLLLFFGLAFSSAQAHWSKVYEYTKETVFVNLDTIQRDGNHVKVWSMNDFKLPQYTNRMEVFRSIKSQAEFNCNEKTMRLGSTTHYSGKSGKGEVVYSNAYFDKPWLPLIPNSLEEREWELACKIQ